METCSLSLCAGRVIDSSTLDEVSIFHGLHSQQSTQFQVMTKHYLICVFESIPLTFLQNFN